MVVGSLFALGHPSRSQRTIDVDGWLQVRGHWDGNPVVYGGHDR